ncbi:MAG: (Fe-S)-binding protein, partial [Thermoanaerobaculia bacterium]
LSYGVLESESCSGHHSRRQGEEMQFQTLAGENIARFKEHAVRKVVAPCPHCFHTIRREYPTLDGDLEIETLHHSELLVQLIKAGDLELTDIGGNGKRVTYHDPCYLGRYEKIYDAPRDLIARTGFQMTELPRRRERSFCCGGGSAGFMREQEEKRRMDQERKREIVESGAQILITACPECKMMLDATVEETMDLAELVAQALPPQSAH